MKKNIFAKAVSVALSLQMVCAVMPQFSLTASAEKSYYINEPFTSLEKWTKPDKAELKSDEDAPYMRYQSDEEKPTVAERAVDTKPASGDSKNDVYMADFDVRFENENAGVVELWGGSNLGPTII